VEEYQIKRFESAYDYFKHLSTLSLGGLVLIATFIGQLKTLDNTYYLSACVIGFVSTIVCSTINHTLAIIDHPSGKRIGTSLSFIQGAVLFINWISILVAVISLGMFCISNIT
jgi:hypothetical protein